jgi:serine/threonine-protein kinase
VWNDPVVLWGEAAMAASDHWVPYVPLGEELHRAGRHEDAVNALSTAIRLRPTERDAYKQLGVCLIETGKLEEAAAKFRELERMDPQSGDAPFGLGLVAIAEGRSSDAHEFLTRAVQRDPSNLAARRALAELEERMRGGAGRQ